MYLKALQALEQALCSNEHTYFNMVGYYKRNKKKGLNENDVYEIIGCERYLKHIMAKYINALKDCKKAIEADFIGQFVDPGIELSKQFLEEGEEYEPKDIYEYILDLYEDSENPYLPSLEPELHIFYKGHLEVKHSMRNAFMNLFPKVDMHTFDLEGNMVELSKGQIADISNFETLNSIEVTNYLIEYEMFIHEIIETCENYGDLYQFIGRI